MDDVSEIIQPNAQSHLWSEWTEVSLIAAHGDRRVYRGKRYGRWFILKTFQHELESIEIHQLLAYEFALGVQLDHPNIAHTLTLETIPEIGDAIVIEFIDGCTLSDFMATHPDKNTRTRVAKQLLAALSYLHSKQMIHGDLKPSNILITHNGHNLKLIDFGLSSSDDAVCRKQDCCKDIMAYGQLLTFLRTPYSYIGTRCARGYYTSCDQVERAIHKSDTLRRWWPLGLGIVCLLVALGLSLSMFAQMQHKHHLITLAHHIVDEQAAIYFGKPFDNQQELYLSMNEFYLRWAHVRDSISLTIEDEALRNEFLNASVIYCGQVAQQKVDSFSSTQNEKD